MEEEAKSHINHSSSRNGLSNLEPIPEEEAKSDVVNYSSQNEGDKKKLSVRLSRWFVGHQKIDGWNQNSINALHAGLVGFLVVAYICHIAGGPIFQSYMTIEVTAFVRILESSFLFVAFIFFLKISHVNGSWAAAKMLRIGSARIYVYGFWLLRSIVVEILKGQPVYAFLVSFHSIVIYATDTWYLCNQKTWLPTWHYIC